MRVNNHTWSAIIAGSALLCCVASQPLQRIVEEAEEAAIEETSIWSTIVGVAGILWTTLVMTRNP